MPKSITGITPAPTPRHNDEPSSNPLSLIVPDGIRRKDGLYRLNDIHKLAGGIKKQSPNYYLESSQGKEILKIYEENQNTENSALYICSIRGSGKNRGTYADFAIALDYASWIDKRFFILLSQYVRNGITPPQLTFSTLEQEVNFITRLTNRMRDNGSIAGYVLNKCKFRKVIDRQLQLALERQQLTLVLGE